MKKDTIDFLQESDTSSDNDISSDDDNDDDDILIEGRQESPPPKPELSPLPTKPTVKLSSKKWYMEIEPLVFTQHNSTRPIKKKKHNKTNRIDKEKDNNISKQPSKKRSKKSKLSEMHPIARKYYFSKYSGKNDVLELIKNDIEQTNNLIQHMDDKNKKITLRNYTNNQLRDWLTYNAISSPTSQRKDNFITIVDKVFV